jgi:ABC-type Zn uptake system ZnuABC Zn-binding protein ZnuA
LGIEKLAELDPPERRLYKKNAEDYSARLSKSKIAEWEKRSWPR